MKTYSITDTGALREMNQDYFFASDEPVGNLPNLYIVADGMGGHKAGDYASRYTTQRIVASVSRSSGEEPVTILKEAITTANRLLITEAAEDEAKKTAQMVALAAIKYGDLSNQASKDYIFDVERFTSFEGDTGPYILYTIVRIKSILAKYAATGKNADQASILKAESAAEKELMMNLAGFNAMMENAWVEMAPHKVCAYIYDLANAFNHFYHATKIMQEEDEVKQAGYIALLRLTKEILETCIDVLGFSAPDRM